MRGSAHHSSTIVKLLLLGDAKSGKTPKDTLIPGTSANGQLVVKPGTVSDSASTLNGSPSGAGNAQ